MRAKRFWSIVKASPPLIGLVICLIVWMCRQPPEAIRGRWLTQHGYAEVPFQVSKGGTFDIMASANGKPLLLLIDTGAEFNVVDVGVQERLDLRQEPVNKFVVNVTGRTQPHGRIFVKDFAVGDLHGEWQAMVFDRSNKNKRRRQFGEAPCDGRLGTSYLLDYDGVIDCGSKKLFLWNRVQGSGATTDRGNVEFTALLKKQGYQELPLSYYKNDMIPHVTATIKGEPLNLDVDTGTTPSYLDLAFAERLHLPKYDHRSNDSFAAIHAVYKTRVDGFSLGGHAEALEALLQDLGQLNAVHKKIGEPTVDGILGAPFLLAHAAVIDFGSKKLYVLAR